MSTDEVVRLAAYRQEEQPSGASTATVPRKTELSVDEYQTLVESMRANAARFGVRRN